MVTSMSRYRVTFEEVGVTVQEPSSSSVPGGAESSSSQHVASALSDEVPCEEVEFEGMPDASALSDPEPERTCSSPCNEPSFLAIRCG